MKQTELYRDYVKSPIGNIEVIANDQYLLSIYFVKRVKSKRANTITNRTCRQLQEYFSGKRRIFDLPLYMKGTRFQQSVWKALTKINYGETCSYADVAKKIKNPKAVRAVGSANGKNPISIVVPCHRVIASDGSLAGYASGTNKKAWLLKHESN